MVLREARPMVHRVRPHRRVEPLGQRHRIVPGTGPVYPAPGDDRQPLARLQSLRRLVQSLRARGGPVVNLTRLAWLGLSLPVVHRNRDEGWSPRCLHSRVVGPLYSGGHVLGAVGLVAPLDVRKGHLYQPAEEEGLVGKLSTILLAG